MMCGKRANTTLLSNNKLRFERAEPLASEAETNGSKRKDISLISRWNEFTILD